MESLGHPFPLLASLTCPRVKCEVTSLPRSPWSAAIRLTDSFQRTKHNSSTRAAHDGQRNEWWRVSLSWDWTTLSTSHLKLQWVKVVFELCIKFSFQIYNSLGWVFQLNISETSTSTNHGSCSLICQVWLSFPIMFYSGQACAGAQYWTVNIKPPSISLVFPLCLELWRLPRLPIFLKVHNLCLQFWRKHKLALIFQWRTLDSVNLSPGSKPQLYSH